MSEDTQPQSPNLDINNIDLSTVETDFPLLDSGLVQVQIQECEFKVSDKGSTYLEVKHALTAAHKTTGHNGMTIKPINPGDRGSTITERIYYGVSYKKDPGGKPYGVDRIAKLREAVFGKAKPGDKFVAPEMLGQNLTIRLFFNPSPSNKDTGEVFGPRTEVADYVRKQR